MLLLGLSERIAYGHDVRMGSVLVGAEQISGAVKVTVLVPERRRPGRSLLGHALLLQLSGAFRSDDLLQLLKAAVLRSRQWDLLDGNAAAGQPEGRRHLC